MTTVFILLILFQIKHFFADYPMQNSFMLGKFKDKRWVLPLSTHCLVHATFAFFICLIFVNPFYSLCLSVLDFSIHFIMDRIKASPKLLGRYQVLSKEQFKGLSESRALAVSGTKFIGNNHLVNESNRLVKEIDGKFKSNVYFWWALGLDQAVHHLTHYLIIYLLVNH